MSQRPAKTPTGPRKKEEKLGLDEPTIDLAEALAKVLESRGYKLAGRPHGGVLKGKMVKRSRATSSIVDALVGATPKANPQQAEKLRDAVRRHRKTKRQKGMKLIQFWVPDTSAPGFAEEARRQSALIAAAAADPTSDEAEMNREMDAWAGAASADEPDYDWGPKGPPK